MPLSLALHLYRLCQNTAQKKFQRDNTVLEQSDIEILIQKYDLSRAMRIFHSAVVDHADVDGRKYHLNYPLNPVFAHDGFKRAAIAHAIARRADGFEGESFEQARRILHHLLRDRGSAGWVKIFAAHALGCLARHHPEIAEEYQEFWAECFSESSASVLSALMFCDAAIDGPKGESVRTLIRAGAETARYRPQKEMVFYYLLKSPHFADPLQTHPDLSESIRAFLSEAKSGRGFSSGDFTEGLKVIGLLSWNRDASLWPSTPHYTAVRRLKSFAGDLISAAGAAVR